MKEQRKVAVVTGGSRGIGQSIAMRLAKDGFAVIVNYAGSVDDAETTVDEIISKDGKAIAVQADVSVATEVANLFKAAEKAFGGIDVLVNNAGIMKLASIAESSDELFDSLVAINLKGTFNGIREAIRRLRNGGRIINLSSTVAALKFENYGVYASTKAAIEVMTGIAAKELRGRGITVNAVAPGPTATDLFLTGKSKEVIDRLSKIAPLERLGTPDDIASVVSFLAGSNGGWVNGQTLRANGGVI